MRDLAPKMVCAFAVLMPMLALSVVLQGIFFAGRYTQGQAWYQAAHLHLGHIATTVMVVCLLAAVLARFPQATRILPLTVVLALLWVAQYLLGQYSDVRTWFSFIHIPLAFVIFGLTLILSGRGHRHMAERRASAPDGAAAGSGW